MRCTYVVVLVGREHLFRVVLVGGDNMCKLGGMKKQWRKEEEEEEGTVFPPSLKDAFPSQEMNR